ncbi:MAG: hypothetical protein DHS20C21_09250 [Gemmatimonadota bacterium]|nr:MAG: hypothetical protein DHS20C21_09250 [Gemmatimonadota bacterium]
MLASVFLLSALAAGGSASDSPTSAYSHVGYEVLRGSGSGIAAFGAVLAHRDSGGEFELSMQYGQESVFTLTPTQGRERMDHVFRSPRLPTPGNATGDASLYELAATVWGNAEFAVRRSDGVRYIKTHSDIGLVASSSTLSDHELLTALSGVLVRDNPIIHGVVALLRMEQRIDGEWHSARHYGMDSLVHFFAPTGEVELRVTAVPLLVSFFADRVEVAELPASQRSGLQARLSAGFEGIPPPLDHLDGATWPIDEPQILTFSTPAYNYSAQATVIVLKDGRPLGGADGLVSVRSTWDLFDSKGGDPVFASVGSDTYKAITYRAQGLLDLLGERGPWYPPSDARFPEWTKSYYD